MALILTSRKLRQINVWYFFLWIIWLLIKIIDRSLNCCVHCIFPFISAVGHRVPGTLPHSHWLILWRRDAAARIEVSGKHADLLQLWSMDHLIGLRWDELLSASHRADLCCHLSATPSYDHPLVFLTGSVPIFPPRYLIPCNHMMLSQRRVVGERDCYSVSAAKILALTPSCCSPDHSPPPLRQLDSILFSKGGETPNNTSATGEKDKTLGGEMWWIHYSLDLIFAEFDIFLMSLDNTVPTQAFPLVWEQEDI